MKKLPSVTNLLMRMRLLDMTNNTFMLQIKLVEYIWEETYISRIVNLPVYNLINHMISHYE